MNKFDNDYIPRPVRPLDVLVILLEFVHNIAQVFEVLTDSFYELAIYHSNHKTKTNKAWEDMVSDLEKIQEETDG